MQGTGVGGAHADGLGDEAYDQLRQSAATYREALVVRLCGEVGLRPPEIARVRPSDFVARSTENGTHHRLSVTDDDGEPTREAYVPSSVRAAVRRYVNEQGVADSDRLVDVTPRRIQMLLSEVADRAASVTGDETLADVSSADLCRYYARRLVHDEDVDPRVVLAVGPWAGLESLCRHLDPVDVDAVLGELERAGLPGPGAEWDPAALGRALATADLGVLVTDGDGTVEYANDRLTNLTGYPNGDLTGTPVERLYAADDGGALDDVDGATRVRLVGRDGDRVDAVQVAAPLADGSAHVAAFVEPDGDESTEPTDRPRTLPRVTGAIEALGVATDVLGTASKRTEVGVRICDRLAATDAYSFAWMGSTTGDRGVVSTAWAGVDESVAEALAEATTEDDDLRTARSGRPDAVRVLGNGTRELRPPSLAAENGEQPPDPSIAIVPLTYGDTTHGLLALGTTGDDAFGPDERRLLATLGWQIGQAITDIKRKNLLLADSVIELEFRVESERAFFVTASEHLGASFELQGIVPGEGGSLLYFVTMRGTSPEEAVEFAADVDSIENARLIRDYDESYLVEFVVDGEEPATTLTELGGHVVEFLVEDGAQRITAEFTTETDVRAVFNGFQSPFQGSALLSKQEVERPVQTTDGFRRSLEDDLTSKQQSVLRAAYLAGYFEWPRGSTAEELADSIGVSSPTLHNHLRKAQQKLLTAFFDDE
ncbi:bacterio-opsin activator domain-containing protein [Halosimplex salinum]|uniref:bacterio-opsin activator domain-containing protein n=1 Tax=Halosimplex salinum TaxID=1710538 RepID=UPI0013DDEBF6|nr:bacterio-opsin activator domain-containing protein [Halosimplex salinum]